MPVCACDDVVEAIMVVFDESCGVIAEEIVCRKSIVGLKNEENKSKLCPSGEKKQVEKASWA